MATPSTFNRETTESLLGRANMLLESGNDEQAIACYRAVIDMDPGNHLAHYYLAYAYFRLGLYDESIKHLKKILKHNKSAKSYNLLGKCHLLVGDFEKSTLAYTRSIKLQKDNIEAISGLANVMAEKGEYKAAYNQIAPYIKSKIPDIALAHTASIICAKTGDLDIVLDYLLAIEQSPVFSDPFVKSQQYYLIAGIYDKKCQYSDAMHYYHLANTSKSDTYEPMKYDQAADSIKNAYSPAFFMQNIKSSVTSDKPIFIVGMPRSGTTLVEQILSSHSRIYGAGELAFMGKKYYEFTNSEGILLPHVVNGFSPSQLDEISMAYLDYITSISGDSDFVTDKMPHNFVYLGFISQLFPNSKVIYCRRNAIDTCLSIYCTSFNDSHPYSTRFSNIAHHYQFCEDMMSYWKSLLPVPIFEVNYEDLVTDVENSLDGLFSFCGLDIEADCFEFYENGRFVNTASKEQINKPIYTTSIERWKNYMPGVQPLVDELSRSGLV